MWCLVSVGCVWDVVCRCMGLCGCMVRVTSIVLCCVWEVYECTRCVVCEFVNMCVVVCIVCGCVVFGSMCMGVCIGCVGVYV